MGALTETLAASAEMNLIRWNGAANAALLAAEILAVSDGELAAKLDEKRRQDAEKVLEKDRKLNS